MFKLGPEINAKREHSKTDCIDIDISDKDLIIKSIDKLKLIHSAIIAYNDTGYINSSIIYDVNVGICSNFSVLMEFRISMSTLRSIANVDIADWPHYSGDEMYPIVLRGDNVKYKDPEQLYNNTDNKYEGEYGMLRLNLLAWLIKQLEDKLGDND